MDREISKEQRNREKRRMWMKWGGTVVVGIVAVIALMQLMQESLHERDIVFSVVDEGSIDVSVSASGKVVPAFEEIINSPINSRILEVYKKGGDSVEVGTPILRLDLLSAETDYKKQLDEVNHRNIYQLFY